MNAPGVGEPCKTAINKTNCLAVLQNFRLLPMSCGLQVDAAGNACAHAYVVATLGDDVVAVDVSDGATFTRIFGPITSWQEAIYLVNGTAMVNGACHDEPKPGYRSFDGGFDVLYPESCPAYAVYRVGSDGTVMKVSEAASDGCPG